MTENSSKERKKTKIESAELTYFRKLLFNNIMLCAGVVVVVVIVDA